MQAREGDRIVVPGRTVGQPDRFGTVLEVKPGLAQAMYRIAWEDGSESMFMPSVGSAVVEADGEEGQREIRLDCRVELTLTETDRECVATASMSTSRGMFTAQGTARRNPSDPAVPMIGEELAIGRALSGLGAQLMGAASAAIDAEEDRPIHLIAP